MIWSLFETLYFVLFHKESFKIIKIKKSISSFLVVYVKDLI